MRKDAASPARITAILTGQAYSTSSQLAARLGPFEGYRENEHSMLGVIEMHRDVVGEIDPACPEELRTAARLVWDECIASGRRNGYRNAQVTVLAPTGTIAFMMDCDTTGIEPDIALVKYKQLAGGGMMKMVNHTVPAALPRLPTTRPPPIASSATSTSTTRLKGRPISRRNTCRFSTALPGPKGASGRCTGRRTCG